METDGMEPFLTTDEVCKFLRVDRSTLGRWRRGGRVRVYRTPGGQLRYRSEDVQQILREE